MGLKVLNFIIYYLGETAKAISFSFLEKLKSENNTLLAIKTKAISRKIRLIFFMFMVLIRFGTPNFYIIFGKSKKNHKKSLNSMRKMHFIDKKRKFLQKM